MSISLIKFFLIKHQKSINKISITKKGEKELDNVSTTDKLKIAKLLPRMLQIILGVQIEMPDERLVNLYIKYVSRIDDKNPIKNLLLLKESFACKFLRFIPEPDWKLSSYDTILESEKERDEHNRIVKNDEDII